MANITLEKTNDYGILRLNRGKANPINHELISEMRTLLIQIADDPSIRGVVLTGNTPGYFSVGLDLKEIYYYDQQEIIAFWDNWDNMVLEITHDCCGQWIQSGRWLRHGDDM